MIDKHGVYLIILGIFPVGCLPPLFRDIQFIHTPRGILFHFAQLKNKILHSFIELIL